MGQEFAQEREWSEKRELDWYLLDDPKHKHMQDWVKALLHLYRKILVCMSRIRPGQDLSG